MKRNFCYSIFARSCQDKIHDYNELLFHAKFNFYTDKLALEFHTNHTNINSDLVTHIAFSMHQLIISQSTIT